MARQSQTNNGTEKSMEEFKVLFPETKSVQVGTKTFEVTRLNIRQYHKVLESLGGLFVQLQETPELLDNFQSQLPKIVLLCFDQVVTICAASIDVSTDYIQDNFDMVGLTRLANAIFELNDFDEIIKNLQSLWGMVGIDLTSLMDTETTETS